MTCLIDSSRPEVFPWCDCRIYEARASFLVRSQASPCILLDCIQKLIRTFERSTAGMCGMYDHGVNIFRAAPPGFRRAVRFLDIWVPRRHHEVDNG